MMKGTRCAVAIARQYREIANAIELRIAVDSELRWSKLFRGVGLNEEAASMRRSFEDRGWNSADEAD